MSYPLKYTWFKAPPDTKQGRRERILHLQGDIQESLGYARDELMPAEEAERICPILHHFAPGLYAREMRMPAGATVIGKIHRHAHLICLMQGRAVVADEDGSRELAAPLVWTSKAGAKRAIYALEDSVFVTYHPIPNDTHDLEQIEAHVIAPTFDDLVEMLPAPDHKELPL